MMDLFKITETIIITSSYIEKCKKNKFKFVHKYRLNRVKKNLKKQLEEDTIERKILIYEEMKQLYSLVELLVTYTNESEDIVLSETIDYMILESKNKTETFKFKIHKKFRDMHIIYTYKKDKELKSSMYLLKDSIMFTDSAKDMPTIISKKFVNKLVESIESMIDKVFEI